MRWLFLGAAALLLCACAEPRTASGPESAGCTRSASRQVAWSDAGVPDTVSVKAEGPTCRQAVVSFVVRNAHGDPLWQFISTYHDMTVGGVAPEDGPAVAPQQVDRFLAGWADVTAQTSDRLPQWPQGEADIRRTDGGLTYSTAFSRDAYEAIRQRRLRMICYAAAADATQCLVIDPASNAPAMIVAYGA